MADLWKHLFEHAPPSPPREDVPVARLGERLAAAEARAERLELVVGGLVAMLELKGLMTRDELAVLVTRLDLADGHEDGRIGPDESQSAPHCGACARPLNARRKACVYCGAEVPRDLRTKRPFVRHVECRSCSARIPEDGAYFSGSGLVCDVCYLSS